MQCIWGAADTYWVSIGRYKGREENNFVFKRQEITPINIKELQGIDREPIYPFTIAMASKVAKLCETYLAKSKAL